MTNFHTEVHHINNNDDMIIATQYNDDTINLKIYDTPEDFAANQCIEFNVSYEFLQEILRVRKHRICTPL